VVGLAVGPAWAASRPVPESAGVARVAVVQPGVLGDADARLDREIELTDAVADQQPDLVVWGESSVGYDLRSNPEVQTRLVALARRTGADVLVNVDARAENGTIYKTSVLVTPSGVDGRYVKTRLVPFGEYIPMRRLLGWITSFSDAADLDRGRGDGPVVLDNNGVRVGPLICFESTFPDMARREVPLGAQLIVYQTSDSTFQGMWAQPQHASLAAVRAVETGRPVVQVALTGISTAYDATGHQLLWVTPGQGRAETLALTLTGGRTPYDVAGDWVLALSAMLIAAALIAASLAAKGSEALRASEVLDEEAAVTRPPARVAVDD
jgi:apolipoprotein N-acyltransferase